MRRTAGIVVPLVIIVALLAGFAIGHMAGGSSAPSPRIQAPPASLTTTPAPMRPALPASPAPVAATPSANLAFPGIVSPALATVPISTPSPQKLTQP